MNAIIKKYFRPVASAALAVTFAVAAPLAASAQQAEDQQLQGTVQSINSTFNITVLDSNGNLDNVELHQGTVINPTGLTLAPGMNVTVDGYADGSQFDANVIQTPYQYSGPAPIPVYYGPGWWYPGFAYGYGPSFSLFIGTGGGPWLYRQPWGGRWYASTPVHTFVGVRGGYTAGARYPAAVNRYSSPAAHYAGGGYTAARAYSAPRSYAAPASHYSGGGYTGRSYGTSAARYSAPAAAHYSGGGSRGSSGGSRGHNR
jgi:hypothetical protein